MKRMRVIGLCLVAVFAMMAVAASSAFAEAPEFGRCVAKAGGKFKTSGCTVASTPGEEKFEWVPGVIKNKFHSKLKEGIPTLETVSGTKITCKGEESPGEFKNTKEVGGVIAKFTGCETSGLKCATVGDAEGEIVTHPLGGVLGVEKFGLTPAANKLAVELHSEAGNVAEFSCAGLPVVVRGSVLHNVTANKMLLSATEKFVATAGEQKPDKFAGGPVDQHILESNTNGGPFEEAGQTITALNTYEEKVEASSVN